MSGEFFQRAAVQMAREALKQLHDVATHQRLAAGDAQLARAARHKGAAQTIQLLKRQQIALGQEIHILRHAIDAAEIAAIRHRDAHIGDGATEGVDQGGRLLGRRWLERRRLGRMNVHELLYTREYSAWREA